MEYDINYHEKLAEQGNAIAQYNLGNCYAKKQDFQKAIYWYEKSAMQGYSYAQFNLGLSYAKGEGVMKDINKAIFWYKEAAKQGNDNAIDILKKAKIKI